MCVTVYGYVYMCNSWVCTVLFFSTSPVIDCDDRLRNDLYCVDGGVKLYSNLESVAQQRAFTSCAAEFQKLVYILPPSLWRFDHLCSYSKSALFYISFQSAVMWCLRTQAVCNPCNFLLYIYANGIRKMINFSIFKINLLLFRQLLIFSAPLCWLISCSLYLCIRLTDTLHYIIEISVVVSAASVSYRYFCHYVFPCC